MRTKTVFIFQAVVVSILWQCPAIQAAGDPNPVLLWPNGAPGSEGQNAPIKIEPPAPDHDYVRVTSIHKPSITPYLPESANATGAGVIICPGGAHAFLAWDIEGENVAKWLAAHGVAGFPLQYRLAREPNSHYQVEVHALQDTQRAIRLVRSRASEWGLSPDRIGVMGFSAGGQLAALAASRFDAGLTNAADAIDRVSCKPDFQALLYPAIPKGMTFTKGTTPPAFLVCGNDDRTNISEGLPELYLQFKQAGVPVELHVYAGTGHGFGLRPTDKSPAGEWPQRFLEWAGHSGLLKKP